MTIDPHFGKLKDIMVALQDEGELSSEQLQKKTGRSKHELFPVLTKLLETKAIRKKGERRATRYYVK